MTGPADVTDETFGDAVLGSARPVLVDFWAPWCAPCRLVSPVVEQLGEELGDRLSVARVNVDENVGVASRYAVFSLPTLVLFRDGEEVERVVGFRRKEDLAERVASHLG